MRENRHVLAANNYFCESDLHDRVFKFVFFEDNG